MVCMRVSFCMQPRRTMPKRERTMRLHRKSTTTRSDERKVIEVARIGEVGKAAELAAARERHAVVAAELLLADGEVEEHLRERERQHDEVDAARAHAERADDEREKARTEHRGAEVHEAVRDAAQHQRADNVGAGAEIGGVAEAQQAAVAQDEVEADGEDAEDGHPRAKDEGVVVSHEGSAAHAASAMTASTTLRGVRCAPGICPPAGRGAPAP